MAMTMAIAKKPIIAKESRFIVYLLLIEIGTNER
jgi:hypothetical protein